MRRSGFLCSQQDFHLSQAALVVLATSGAMGQMPPGGPRDRLGLGSACQRIGQIRDGGQAFLTILVRRLIDAQASQILTSALVR
jgi:hypothetical protein